MWDDTDTEHKNYEEELRQMVAIEGEELSPSIQFALDPSHRGSTAVLAVSTGEPFERCRLLKGRTFPSMRELARAIRQCTQGAGREVTFYAAKSSRNGWRVIEVAVGHVTAPVLYWPLFSASLRPEVEEVALLHNHPAFEEGSRAKQECPSPLFEGTPSAPDIKQVRWLAAISHKPGYLVTVGENGGLVTLLHFVPHPIENAEAFSLINDVIKAYAWKTYMAVGSPFSSPLPGYPSREEQKATFGPSCRGGWDRDLFRVSRIYQEVYEGRIVDYLRELEKLEHDMPQLIAEAVRKCEAEKGRDTAQKAERYYQYEWRKVIPAARELAQRLQQILEKTPLSPDQYETLSLAPPTPDCEVDYSPHRKRVCEYAAGNAREEAIQYFIQDLTTLLQRERPSCPIDRVEAFFVDEAI